MFTNKKEIILYSSDYIIYHLQINKNLNFLWNLNLIKNRNIYHTFLKFKKINKSKNKIFNTDKKKKEKKWIKTNKRIIWKEYHQFSNMDY